MRTMNSRTGLFLALGIIGVALGSSNGLALDGGGSGPVAQVRIPTILRDTYPRVDLLSDSQLLSFSAFYAVESLSDPLPKNGIELISFGAEMVSPRLPEHCFRNDYFPHAGIFEPKKRGAATGLVTLNFFGPGCAAYAEELRNQPVVIQFQRSRDLEKTDRELGSFRLEELRD